MKLSNHPAFRLDKKWITTIREHAADAESTGQLTDAQLQLIYDQNWFKLFVPKVYGGLESSLPEAVKLEEALSWADGSLGWTVTLCCGAGWFGGLLDKELAKELFTDPKVCFGGSGAPSGVAEKKENGYQISGKWKYATGAPHLTHFTINCNITENGKEVLDKNSNQQILPFLIDKKDVTVLNEWDTTGLIATASRSFTINNLYVSANRSFKIFPPEKKAGGIIYDYPFLQFAEATLAANISGMAIHFLDLCEETLPKVIFKKSLNAQQESVILNTLHAALSKLNKARFSFFIAVEESWFAAQRSSVISEKITASVSLTSRHLAKTSRQIVDELYPFCGLYAANPQSEMNRVWRDIHTASQHTLLTLPV